MPQNQTLLPYPTSSSSHSYLQMFEKFYFKYKALVDAGDNPSSEMLISDGEGSSRTGKRWNTISFWLTAMNTVFFLAGLTCFLGNARLRSNPPSAECLLRVSSFSPALGVVKYTPLLFDLSSKKAMIYQGSPTPALDAAWENITDGVRPTRISERVLAQLSTPDDDPTMVRYPDYHGGGIMASLGVFHQLHCVNLLRKSTYREYYENDRFFQVPPDHLRAHLDHCIELLREVVACAGDVTIITYNWVPEKNSPVPNFKKVHQCRKFDDILEWGLQNAVHVPAFNKTKPLLVV